MIDAFASGLIWPAATLGLLGWVVPRLLSLVFPEGVRPLLALAALSILIMLGLGMATFAGIYLWRGVPLGALAEGGIGPALGHFLRLGAVSAMFWGPVLLLSVAGLPRGWVNETW
ncbi:hypothetical protein [Wenxinia saemankumensis]|uniref:Uncharacterized protein n=1 Tax=Wenxinia saemankumensis TaxID=1447782 RepID=A0A1M6C1W3_9RHOB|nr:hypothetical protein [Wenxinia saemankumensis]SHI54821.1 hypothetical protein SAMN05444417_0955 [Wenxinia saemankumensis]